MSRTETSRPVAPSRWKSRALTGLGAVLLLIWAAPIIVGYTSLVDQATARVEALIDGKVQVGGVSLGWFSPIVLHDVVVRDAENVVLAHIPRVEGDRALFKLLLDQNDLGSYRLDKAKIDIRCQGNSSNLERILAKSLREPAAPTSAGNPAKLLPPLHLETVDATLTIHDDDTKQAWKMHAVSLSGRILDSGKTAQLNMHGALHDGIEPGALKLEIHVQDALEPNVSATAKGKFTSLPMAMANVIARRYQPGFELAGSLQGNFQLIASLKDGKPNVQAQGELMGNQITFRTPQLADQLHVQRLTAPCAIRIEAGKLIAERLEIESEFGKVSVQGSLDLERDLSAALDQAGFEFALDVNLAIVAERLPKTLHLHRDLRLTAGQLQVKCKSVASNGAIVWQGKLHASDIRGIKGKQTIAWSDPMTLAFQARDLHKGVPLIDSLQCSARFLRVEGTQTAEQFILTAEADLQQLAEPLGQFIDFDAVTLAGRASAKVVVSHARKNQFDLQGTAQFKDMNFAWFTKHPWQEPLVAAKFEAHGSTDPAGKTRIDQGSFEIRLGNDVAIANVTEPIADVAQGPWGTLAIRVDGDIARWHNRARSWTTAFDDCQLAGLTNIQLRARVSAASIECTGVNIHATNLRCATKSVWINEPTLSLTTACRWNMNTGQLALTQAKLISTTLQADSAALTFTPATMAMRGSANVTGDLARLRQWTLDPKAKPGEPVTGTLVARLDLDTVGVRVGAGVNLSVKNFTYGPALNPTWREAELKGVGKGVIDLARDALRIDKLHLVGATFGAEVKGNVANLKTTTDVDLTGTLAYDLEKLEPQLRSILGKDIKIVGKDARSFKVAGSLYPKSPGTAGPGLAAANMRFVELNGDASVNWTSLKALGCDVGPTEVRAILQKGWFQLYPIEATLNNGKLRLQPNVRLDPEPMEMILLAGPVIEKAQITPAMCAGALAYALPVLANVAEAEGTLSLALEGGRLPLAAPTTGELRGTITLHAGKLGPGPVVRELSGLLRVPPPRSLVRESKVPFHMIGGKVHHRDLELVFPDYTLKSSGAVGMDGSLALVIEMPIPPQLANALKLTPSQAKQLLRIPIGGTLDHPRPDPRALESLTAIVGRSFLENQLNKLLQPKR